jgi:hypothetical protein
MSTPSRGKPGQRKTRPAETPSECRDLRVQLPIPLPVLVKVLVKVLLKVLVKFVTASCANAIIARCPMGFKECTGRTARLRSPRPHSGPGTGGVSHGESG